MELVTCLFSITVVLFGICWLSHATNFVPSSYLLTIHFLFLFNLPVIVALYHVYLITLIFVFQQLLAELLSLHFL